MIPMQRLTAVNGAFRARILEARLHFEGIDVELRGAIDSPYLLTVGDLARVELYVPADQMEDAQLVLLAGEIDSALAAPREWSGERPRRSPWARWAALAALLSAALAPIIWYTRLR